MKRSFEKEFGIMLTLPLGIERRPRARKQRLRRLGVIAFLLGAALLAMGWYLPARAADTPAQFASASRSTLASIITASSDRERGSRPRSRAM